METKKTNVKIKENKKRRISIFTVILIALIIAVLISIGYLIRYVIINIKYQKYTDKMYEYGYNELYNNKKASATEKITNIEIIKVITGALKNTVSVDKIDLSNNSLVNDDDKWYEFVTELGYNTRIEKEELDIQAKKIDAVILLTNMVEKMLGKELKPITLKMSDSNLAKFTDDTKDIIAKAVALGLIDNSNSELSDKLLIKGELNKLVITIVEKYSTMYYENEFYKEQDGQTVKGNIVIDDNKKPTNYEYYPYIVDNISNDIYEIKFKEYTSSELQTPKEIYSYMRDLYMQIDELVTDYLNVILNVDYEKITINDFLDSIDNKVLYGITEDDVKDYINYVKENKIKIEGSAEPLLPIIYYVDGNFLVRTKITFKVLNSETKYNLLFGDETSGSVKYDGNEYTIYVDFPTGMTFNSYSLRAKISCIAENIIRSNGKIEIEK